jgi:type IV secretion system protein VirB9
MNSFSSFCILGACTILLMLTGTRARAAEIPTSLHNDKRIGVLTFNADTITHVYVKRGVATHIALGPNDRIRRSASGQGADCKINDADNRWCIHAEVGDTSIFVRPKTGAAVTNNLELVTASRHYSFLFEIVPETPANPDRPAFHRVTFNFDDQEVKAADKPVSVTASNALAATLAALPPKNYEYWMQMLPGSDDIVPTAAYDNGQFTYFKFPNNRLLPSVFAISADGTETMVSKHVEDDTLVIHRVGKQFVLRLDSAVVGVWNQAFDKDGVPPSSGTTIPGIKRVLRGELATPVLTHHLKVLGEAK